MMLPTLRQLLADVDRVTGEDVNMGRRPETDLEELRERVASLRGQLHMLGSVVRALPWPFRWLLWSFMRRTADRVQSTLNELPCTSAAVRQPARLYAVADRRHPWRNRAR